MVISCTGCVFFSLVSKPTQVTSARSRLYASAADHGYVLQALKMIDQQALTANELHQLFAIAAALIDMDGS